MKIARYKRVQRILLFYHHNFGFAHVSSTSGPSKRPIVVLADGTFCKAALDNQLNLQEQLRVYFNQEVKILTTACVVRELELLGGEFYGALHIAKQYKKVSCKHQVKYDEPTPAAECICRAVGKKNEEQYFVATQDPELTENLKTTVAACPIFFIKYRTVLRVLDRPSPLALETAQSKTESKLNVEETQKKDLKNLKRKLIGDDGNAELLKKKRRKIKGPNPLSCKKRKNDPAASVKTVETSERVSKKKRKRKKRKDSGDQALAT